MERFYDCINCMKAFKVSSVTEPSAEIPETKVRPAQFARHQTRLRRYLQTPHLPPSFAQCLQYLQFLQAWQGSAPVQVAASMLNGI